MPEIGVTIERRSSASSASRSASRALLSARSASVTWTAVTVLDDLSAVTRSIRACGVFERDPRPVDGDLLGLRSRAAR